MNYRRAQTPPFGFFGNLGRLFGDAGAVTSGLAFAFGAPLESCFRLCKTSISFKYASAVDAQGAGTNPENGLPNAVRAAGRSAYNWTGGSSKRLNR
eukprot:Skav223665  [mRNA]  locus=scaffold2794:81554:81841:+ [translate_table: standard]